ncbi:MAG: hypothetical protein QOE63_715 [Acidimicrobiaceae bacterium]
MAMTATDSALLALGLRVGEAVRFRRKDGGRWHEATVIGIERDGSVGVRDASGASRALTIERLEVRATGPRGARTWEPLVERAARTEQMSLW